MTKGALPSLGSLAAVGVMALSPVIPTATAEVSMQSLSNDNLFGSIESSSGAMSVCFRVISSECPSRFAFNLDARVSPQSLPKKKLAPVGVSILGRVGARDGVHPPALREMVLKVDKDVDFAVRGLPICEGGLRPPIRRPPGYLRRKCRNAIVGTGNATIEIAFPEQSSIKETSPITIFNGGGSAHRAKLVIHTFIKVPVPAAIVTQVNLRKRGTGIHAVAKIPVIAGGASSFISFRFNLRRFFNYRGQRESFLSARCPDGRFRVSILKAVFRNEANAPSVAPRSALNDNLIVPCRQSQ